MADRERLFFALWPDETLRRQLVKRMARDLRPCGGRRIPPENLHVTLVFLGTLDARQRRRLELAAETVPERAFTLELVEEGTQLTWEVDWQLTSGFSLSSLLIRFSGNGAFEEMMEGSLENLKDLVEQEAAQANASTTDDSAAQMTPDEPELG